LAQDLKSIRPSGRKEGYITQRRDLTGFQAAEKESVFASREKRREKKQSAAP